VWGIRLDPRNFHRKATSTPGFVVATGRTAAGGTGRPARLYRPGPVRLLHPPMLRRDPY
jgi:8-oxo-dGTP diphosphatase